MAKDFLKNIIIKCPQCGAEGAETVQIQKNGYTYHTGLLCKGCGANEEADISENDLKDLLQ